MLPGWLPVARRTSSPFISVSACGIDPLNVVDSSFSSVPNALRELLESSAPSSRRGDLLSTVLSAFVAVISDSYNCSASICRK